MDADPATLVVPTTQALTALVLSDTDFLADVVNSTIWEVRSAATDAADDVVDVWEEDGGALVSPAMRAEVVAALIDHAAMVAKADADELADAIAAGDRDADGEWVPYETYRSAA